MPDVQERGLTLVQNPELDARELEETKEQWRRSELEEFANLLEIARYFFRNHYALLASEKFPERYREVFMDNCEYDPDEERHVDCDDLHILDPDAFEAHVESSAREVLRQRKAHARLREIRAIYERAYAETP